MSTEADKASRTEQATEKRLKDAVDEGNIPVSREVASFAFLLAAMLALDWMAAPLAGQLGGALANLFAEAGDIRVENSADVLLLFRAVIVEAGRAALPFALVFSVAGVAAAVLQNPPSLVLKRVAPDLSRVSPTKGLKRFFSLSGLLESAKTSVRFWVMAASVAVATYNGWQDVLIAAMTSPGAIAERALGSVLTILASLAVISLCIVLLDLPASHVLWRRGLRMAHHEIKEERKQAEGDPQLKARRRAVARARLRRRLKTDVSKATIVIANPTHFAVALRYVRREGGAPRVVAKGQDLIALTIRRVAEEHNIPVVEDKALARSLYKKVSVDQMIPVEFYRIIAEILIKLQSRQRLVNQPRR